jgi:hypothetical protein
MGMPTRSRKELDNTKQTKKEVRQEIFVVKNSTKPTKSSGQKVSKSKSNTPSSWFLWKEIRDKITFQFINVKDVKELKSFASISSTNEKEADLESVQQKFLPHISEQLQLVSKGEICFKHGSVKAIPDAVFYDQNRNTFLVVEYKSWDYKSMWSIKPESVFQALISTEVMKREYIASSGVEDTEPHFESYLRLNNKCIKVDGWANVANNVMALARDVAAIKPSETVGASEASRMFVLFDPIFKCKPSNDKERRFLGILRHNRMSQSEIPVAA